jgi:hypothetical protein
MKTKITGLLLILISAQWSFAQNSAAEQEIISLSKDKWQWMSDKNVDALTNLFHENEKFK